MRISISTTPERPIRTPTSRFTIKEGGFTLIEILVALSLVALVLVISIPSGSTPRHHLDQALDQMERAVRFGVDEATIRNVIVRLHFNIDDDPQEFSIEYGPNAQFIPPPIVVASQNSLSQSEQEELNAQLEEVNRKFNRIRDISQGKFEIYETLQLVGVGNIDQEALTTRGQASIYIYPTGEKDHALIVLSSEDEYVTLEIEPYSMFFQRNYYLHNELDDLSARVRGGDELFKSWSQAR